jgi:hypothetical protein
MKTNVWDILGVVVVLVALVVVFAHTPASAGSDFDGFVFWVESGTRRTVEWVPAENAEGYELYVLRMEDQRRFLSGWLTTAPKIDITWRTRGHYIVFARPWRTVDGAKLFGEWCNSLNPVCGVVAGSPRAWALYVNTP